MAEPRKTIPADAADSSRFPPRDEIAAHLLMDDNRLVDRLIERAVFTEDERRRAAEIARLIAHGARANSLKHAGVDAFMREYGLSSEEGVILMCLAEALLRIPDAGTQDKLIAEKIAEGQWERHRGHSDSFFVNASTWGLMLTGHVVRLREARGTNPLAALKQLAARAGEPVIRQAARHAVRLLGDQFVLGRTIEEALARAAPGEARGVRFSYDMLGEAARTEADARRYFERYLAAIDAIGKAAGPSSNDAWDELMTRPGLSVKLSALHPRFEAGKTRRLEAELGPRLAALLKAARARDIPITIDAEEQDRLDATLALFGPLFADPALDGWHGLGLAVQAYGKRAIPVLRWLRRLSERAGKRIPVRLVKGAYWDSEIKWAQEQGLADYPVFTRKAHTDVSYLACLRLLLSDPRAFYPQFATHNAHTLAMAYVASGELPYEAQRLHGMGEALYEQVAGEAKMGVPVRVYAPVGGHEDLLAYLVRRLLENGANTSFVNRLANEEAPIADIIRDPVEAAAFERGRAPGAGARTLPRPRDIYLPERRASAGTPLYDGAARDALSAEIARALAEPAVARPLIEGGTAADTSPPALVLCPHDHRRRAGAVRAAEPREVERAIVAAGGAAHGWDRLGAELRAQALERAADLFERDRAALIGLVVAEAGKTLEAALAETREAIDYLRYYAMEARRLFARAIELKGPTGERNTLELRPRGVFACISPWNFPLAIFTGQAAAALAAGNAVLAKPAEETPLAASVAARLLHEAGVPPRVLQFLPGGGEIGAALARDPRVGGVAFTGSNGTAWAIQKALADRRGAIVPFIAETGGLNAMIADSSALPEQVARDAIRSAFDSAGQRCSAARLLFVQEDIAPRVIALLGGAIRALDIGDPFDAATDIGPVIGEAAQDALEAHKLRMERAGTTIADLDPPDACRVGTYVGPAAYEIERLDILEREVFGPILHVIRYGRGRLDQVIEALNATGYGLTLGLHSRIAAVADYVAEFARAGNLYVNRDQIGAVVGVQPFGGEGLSGTGPKAGGPNYLVRFATERTRTTDITATGGNVALLGEAADYAAPSTKNA